MSRVRKCLLPLMAALTIAACSINVDEHGVHRYTDYYDGGRASYGMRRVSVEQPFESRQAAGEAMDRTLDAMREAGCDIVSADRWRALYERKGPDVNGMRIVASCPETAALF